MSIVKTTHRSGPYADFMAQAIQVGDTIHLSGQIGVDENGVVKDGLLDQMVQCYENVEAALREFGADMSNVVDEMFVLTDCPDFMSKIEQVAPLREKIYGGIPEVTQTAVQVAALVLPELEIEIRCVARV